MLSAAIRKASTETDLDDAFAAVIRAVDVYDQFDLGGEAATWLSGSPLRREWPYLSAALRARVMQKFADDMRVRIAEQAGY
jgi:hypothetical protein